MPRYCFPLCFHKSIRGWKMLQRKSGISGIWRSKETFSKVYGWTELLIRLQYTVSWFIIGNVPCVWVCKEYNQVNWYRDEVGIRFIGLQLSFKNSYRVKVTQVRVDYFCTDLLTSSPVGLRRDSWKIKILIEHHLVITESWQTYATPYRSY